MAKQSVDLKHCKSGGVRGIQKHCQREPGENHSNKDIDDSRTHLNYDLHNDEKISFTDKVNERIKEGYTGTRKIQSNANVMECVVLQAKKEFFENLTPEKEKEFFQTAYEHICEKYGKENVVSAIVHKDEKTPHMHINFVPIRDGRLCSADLFRKQQMIDLHTDMHKALKERGFDIERGENEQEKREHLPPEKFKLQELEREIAVKKQEVDIKQVDLKAQERDLSTRIVSIKKINMAEHQVDSIERNTKDNKTFGISTGEKIIPKEEFENLISLAKRGAFALEENGRLWKENERFRADRKELQEKTAPLEKENFDLKHEITRYERLFEDKEIKQRMNDIQNPHLAAYRKYKEEVSDFYPFCEEGRNRIPRYEDIACRMIRDHKFDRTQIQEALRQDMNSEKVKDTMSSAYSRINDEEIRAKEQQAKAQAQAEQDRARAEHERIMKEREDRIKRTPELRIHSEYKAMGKSDTEIIFRMKTIDKLPEFKIKEAIVFSGEKKEYAEACIREVGKVKMPTKTQSVGGGTGGGGGGSSHDRASLLNQLLEAARRNSPSPSVGGGMHCDCLSALSDEEIERMEKAMEKGSYDYGR